MIILHPNFIIMQLTDLYRQRILTFTASADALQRRYDRFSFIRLAFFIASVAGIIVLFTIYQWAGVAGLIVFLLVFQRLVDYHDRLLEAKNIQESLVKINEQEWSFMQDDYTVFEDGSAFADPAHPYTIDMDVFGPHAVFQFLNRTTTVFGARRLAAYLSQVAPKEEILKRQAAIAELKDELEWRQLFRAYGFSTKDEPRHIAQLSDWIAQPYIMRNHTFRKVALYLFPLLSFIGLYLWIFHLPWYLAFLFFLPTFYLLKTTLDDVNQIHQQTSKAGETLAHYANLIQHIESKDFKSEQLTALKSALATAGQNASERLKQLAYVIRQLNVRYNFFVILLNLFGLWELHWVLRLENWKARQRGDLQDWFESMAEFETLSSFATIYYNRPTWTFPVITTTPLLEAVGVGHPLISPSKCVTNDIAIPTNGHLKLLTGSNMAGKSTFLRTVGLNIVLAMCGSPVCAQQLHLPILQLYTSMRTQDALHESTSSFYAELKRLKIIIEAVEAHSNVFFLMDEILKGTNSNDRHTGSRALINQMIKSNGSGIIATHDLELGNMAAEADGAIENICIEVDVHRGKLVFDYKIKPGVSQSFNATVLMREMGIQI